jgi:hypothetical protein
MAVATAALETAWVGTNEPQAEAAMAVATAALETAWAGTSTAHEAYDIGRAALDTAWVGTGATAAAYNVGWTALETSWVGTQLGNVAYGLATYAISIAGTSSGGDPTAAYNLGRTALETSWTGTALANTAYGLATYAIGLTGTASSGGGGGADLATAWAGTAAAREARAVAQTALDTAWTGTISHNTLTPATGTLTFDMSGSAYQSAVITGATTITVKNIKAPTQTYIQAITSRLQSNATGTNYVLTWDAFSYLGSLPPATLVNNKSVFVSFTSFGTTIPNVFAAATSQV